MGTSSPQHTQVWWADIHLVPLQERVLVPVVDSQGQLPQDPTSPGTLHAGLEVLLHQHPHILVELHGLQQPPLNGVFGLSIPPPSLRIWPFLL
jgi:hypothetical protein